jgi:hypothetical protein
MEQYRKPADMFPLADQVIFESRNLNSGIFRTKKNPTVLIKHYDIQYSREPDKEIRELTASLCSAQPELMHILPCVGFTKYENGRETAIYALQFTFPLSTEENLLHHRRLLLVPLHLPRGRPPLDCKMKNSRVVQIIWTSQAQRRMTTSRLM